jgi:uncharacterized protein YbjT (DUF2867 family)
MKRVLVLGGTGFVGRTLCDALVKDAGGAARITVPSRRPAQAKTLWMLPGVELLRADVHDEAQLARLLRGQDAVVNLVAILHGSEAAFHAAHVELPRKLARACQATGVRRVVHVSALGAAVGAPSMYQRSKAEGEQVLRKAGLDLTVLRPSVIFGAQDRFLNLFARLQTLFPVMPLACADARFQPVWVNDVAQAIVRALRSHEAIGATYEATGPRQYTLQELVQLAGAWSGHPRRVLPLPAALGRLQARLLELLPGEPLMSRDNLDSMSVPNVASGQVPRLAALGIRPTALEAVMPEHLSRGGEPTRLDGWRREARRG